MNRTNSQGFGIWFKSHFTNPLDIIASIITIIFIVALGITGMLGSDFVSKNIVSIFCTLAALATLWLYEIWNNSRRLSATNSAIENKINELVDPENPYMVAGSKISPQLMKMLEQSYQWSFRGGSGRWQREAVLPYLSTQRDRNIRYKMLILDPTEQDLCTKYAEYRNKHRSASMDDANSVRNDLLACIVACAWYSRQTKLTPSVYLSKTYSPLRQDMNADLAAITVADKTKEGLFVPRESWYYNSLVDEFEQLCDRSTEITLSKTAQYSSDWKLLTDDDVRSALSSSLIVDGADLIPLTDRLQLDTDDYSAIRPLVFKGRLR